MFEKFIDFLFEIPSHTVDVAKYCGSKVLKAYYEFTKPRSPDNPSGHKCLLCQGLMGMVDKTKEQCIECGYTWFHDGVPVHKKYEYNPEPCPWYKLPVALVVNGVVKYGFEDLSNWGSKLGNELQRWPKSFSEYVKSL